MFVFLVVLTCSFVQLQCSWAVVDAGEPDILNNGTILQTEDGDIAHITCILRGEPRPLVRWEKEGEVIKDKDEGIAILSRSNDTLEESHLFVAVTSNGRRGTYICVAVNEKGVSKQSFRITETSGGLSSQDVAAICLSVGLSLFFVLAIGFFLWRGKRKIKLSKQRQRARTLSQCSIQVNGALLEDGIDYTNVPTAKEARNGISKSVTCVTSV